MAAIITTPERFLRTRRHHLMDRQEFIQRNQQANKKVQRYYTELQALNKTVDMSTYALMQQPVKKSTCKTDQLWDCGTKERRLKNPIAHLTLEGALQTCCNYEASHEVNNQLTGKELNTMGNQSSHRTQKKQDPSDNHTKEEKLQTARTPPPDVKATSTNMGTTHASPRTWHATVPLRMATSNEHVEANQKSRALRSPINRTALSWGQWEQTTPSSRSRQNAGRERA